MGAIRATFNPASIGRTWLFGTAAIMIVAIGLRYEVGADWAGYQRIYDYIRLVTVDQAMVRTEPGYALVNLVGTRAGWGIWFPNLVCATIFTWGLFAFCKDEPNPALALAVAFPYLIVGVAMGFTRQSAALGFMLLALHQYFRGTTLRMILALGLAAAFHTSALIAVPIIGLAAARRNVLALAFAGLMGLFLTFQFSGAIYALVSRYTENAYIATGAIPRLAMNVLPALIFLSFRMRFVRSRAELRIWTIFSLLAILSIALLFVVPSSTVVDRLGIYLVPLQVFVLARLPAVFGSAGRQSIAFVLMLLAYSLAVQVVWLTWGAFGHAWIPYRSYLWDTGPEGTPFL